MAIPTVLTDLSATLASNAPAGGDQAFPYLDDYLRAAYGFIRQGDTKASDVASAATTDLGAVVGRIVDISGTTTITSFGTVAAGIWRICRFTGALTLTHHATSLILPGAANITTVSGDCLVAVSLGSGNWVVTHYQTTKAICSFRATSNNAQTSTTATVADWSESHDSGANFNATTGVFTVPHAGLYLFTYSAQATASGAAGLWRVGLTNSGAAYLFLQSAYLGVDVNQRNLSGSVVLSLTAAETIAFGVHTLGANMSIDFGASFSGVRLS